MNKVKDLLIKNVQWLTLLLGLAFLGWMAWTYFVQTNLNVKVDQVTAAEDLPKLETEMNGLTKPNIVVPKYAGELTKGLKGPSTRPTPGQWTTAVPLASDLPGGGALPPGDSKDGQPTPAPGGAAAKGQLTATPELTAPSVIGTSYGLSSVVPATFASNPNPQPPAGVATADKAWITSAYKISVDDIVKDFASVSTPAGLTTLFLRIEVQREEVLPDGSTANPVLVKPLVGSQLSQHPLPPAYDATYIAWADPNQAEILQSPFYIVTGGSTWILPGEKRAPTAKFDPNQYLKGPIPDWLTPDEKKEVADARAAAQKAAIDAEREKNKNKPHAPSPGGGGRGGAGGGGPGGPGGPGRFLPDPDPDFDNVIDIPAWRGLAGADASLFAAANPPEGPPPGGPRPPGMPPGSIPRPPGPEGSPTLPPNPSGEQQPNAAALLGKVPTTAFDPTAWKDGPIIAFAHDETVEPEKTYHYRMRYVMLNPIYGQPNAVANPALAQVFRWESKWSDWTTPYAVPPSVSFFVISKIANGAQTVQFEVFHYAKGALHSKVFTVSPGDMIGTNENDVDLATGYTLVDIRRDAKGVGYALVMAPDGHLVRHDIADTATESYRDLKNQSAARAVGTTGG
jgi:hypothetical protein